MKNTLKIILYVLRLLVGLHDVAHKKKDENPDATK